MAKGKNSRKEKFKKNNVLIIDMHKSQYGYR